jgi:hypothetical protein
MPACSRHSRFSATKIPRSPRELRYVKHGWLSGCGPTRYFVVEQILRPLHPRMRHASFPSCRLKSKGLPEDPLFPFQSCHLTLFHVSGLIFPQLFGNAKVMAKQKKSLVMSSVVRDATRIYNPRVVWFDCA